MQIWKHYYWIRKDVVGVFILKDIVRGDNLLVHMGDAAKFVVTT
jgi:hypothetical protein